MDQKTKAAIALFDNQASVYEEQFMDVSKYASGLDLMCQYLPENAQCLDLACGPGNVSNYLNQQLKNAQFTLVDLSPNMLQLAQKHLPAAQCLEMDCRDVLKLEECYHAILMAFCMPYLSKEDCIRLIMDTGECLEPKGCIFLSTMEGKYSDSRWTNSSDGSQSLYTYFHEEKYLEEALKVVNCKILFKDRITYQHRGEMTTDLIIVAQKIP